MKEKFTQPLWQMLVVLLTMIYSAFLLIIIGICMFIGLFLSWDQFDHMSGFLWEAIPKPDNEYEKEIYQNEDDCFNELIEAISNEDYERAAILKKELDKYK